jgi:signal transduction histidine kinase
VLDPTGTELPEFVTAGISNEERSRLHSQPSRSDWAFDVATDEHTRIQVEGVTDLVKGALNKVRRIAVELRAERPAQTTTTSDLRVEFVAVLTDDIRLPPAVETATYRLVQEAIINAVKHADARTISVSLLEHDGHLASLIEDDGDGFHTSQVSNGRLGLKGMHERANILNGTITVQSTPNHGTAIRARIPVNPPDQEGARA